ncbi:glutathione S-transferase 3-like [Panicum miliaceum]|uniref:glutathione transferase n=1 Tax=Panicum miliaceum TaxID=4540 RepID=A0A3L6QP48_PANMI|nr:glutathione S-transferase 3-like [Panicum miliaceum]
MAAAAGEVTCVDFWANGFGMRARIALRELGVAFRYVEEDLRVRERSELVRRMNPIHRSVPVLIHDGRMRRQWLPQHPRHPDKVLKSKGEEKAAAKEELLDQLRRLEEVLGDRTFFAGDEFGFLDAVLIPFSSMFRGYEQHDSFSIEIECPNLMQWVRRCKERDSVRSVQDDEDKMYELHKKWYGIE